MAINAANLKWYLTQGGGSSDGGAVGTPATSLGGYRSSTAITDASDNNLFDDVSGDEAAAGRTEYRAIAFRNEDATAGGLQDAKVWIETQTPGGDSVEIGLDLAGANAMGDTIADETTAPDPAVTFSSACTSKATGLSLGTLTQNQYYIIWVKRVVPAECAAYNANSFVLKVEGDSAA
jgi:hypothetical protein